MINQDQEARDAFETMAYTLLNHIQGKNGSQSAHLLRDTGPENLLMVAIDAAKYTHKAIICTFYGDILMKPTEFDAHPHSAKV